jgi:hypothetical protein
VKKTGYIQKIGFAAGVGSDQENTTLKGNINAGEIPPVFESKALELESFCVGNFHGFPLPIQYHSSTSASSAAIRARLAGLTPSG